MKVKATELELAKLKANSGAIDNLKRQMGKVQNQIAIYAKRQEELADEIKNRVEDCPDVPLDEWDFSQVDWIAYKGDIVIGDDSDD